MLKNASFNIALEYKAVIGQNQRNDFTVVFWTTKCQPPFFSNFLFEFLRAVFIISLLFEYNFTQKEKVLS